MKTVNITPKTLDIAEKVGLHITTERHRTVIRAEEVTYGAIVMSEESSGLLVEYGIATDGSLFHLLSREYAKDLPATIENSYQLRSLVKSLAGNVNTLGQKCG